MFLLINIWKLLTIEKLKKPCTEMMAPILTTKLYTTSPTEYYWRLITHISCEGLYSLPPTKTNKQGGKTKEKFKQNCNWENAP